MSIPEKQTKSDDGEDRCLSRLVRPPFRADHLPPGSEAVITKAMQGAYGVWFSVGERVTITGADYGRGVRNIKRVIPLGERRELNELIWADVQNLSALNVVVRHAEDRP